MSAGGATTPAGDRTDCAAGKTRHGLAPALAAAGLDWILPAWPAPPGVLALSMTRARSAGGTAAAAPRDAASPAIGADPLTDPLLLSLLPSPPVRLRQVHGRVVTVLERSTLATAREAPPVADAVVTRERGLVCAVRTADCLPVVLADGRGAVVGVAHAGWRGLAAGVLEATVAAMEGLGARRGDLVAWFGPAIGPAHFEVGADVLAAFTADDAGAAGAFAPKAQGKWLADLDALARRRLAAAGVAAVHGGGMCTYADPLRFYSYRRARDEGRMATLAWLA